MRQALLKSESYQPGQLYLTSLFLPPNLTFCSDAANQLCSQLHLHIKSCRTVLNSLGRTSRRPVRQLWLVSRGVFPCRSSQSRFLCRINLQDFWGELPWPRPSGLSRHCRLMQLLPTLTSFFLCDPWKVTLLTQHDDIRMHDCLFRWNDLENEFNWFTSCNEAS